MANRTIRFLFGNFIILSFLGLFSLGRAQPIGSELSAPEFKVAFIGDTNDGEGFQSVLELIKDEDVDLIIHGGDFSYGELEPWRSMINDTLGHDFPYLGSNGNHDDWPTYWNGFFEGRVQTLVGSEYLVDNNDPRNYSLTYGGIKMVFLGDADPEITASSYVSFVNRQLSSSDANWKICNWHRTGVENQTTEPPGRAMLSTGGKPNEMSSAVYEACRKNGALIVTAHEHAYLRTFTITKFENLDREAGLNGIQINSHLPSDSLQVGPGSTFVAVSGLGGSPWKGYAGYDFSCDHHNDDWWWATIYTLNYYLRNGVDYRKDCTVTGRDDYGNEYLNDIWKKDDPGGVDQFTWGALFITFNADGDPGRAAGYFKNIDGQIVDEFRINSGAGLHNLGSDASPQIFLSTPVADAYVDSASPENNYGLDEEIQVDGEPSFKIGYIKFDLSSLAGENILSAKMRVRVSEDSGADSLTTQTVKLAEKSEWTETEINYENRPDLSAVVGTILSGEGSQSDWKEIDVTEIVKMNSGQIVTFGIDAPVSSDDGLDLFSRETASAPQIQIILEEHSGKREPTDKDGNGMISLTEFLAWFRTLFSNP